MALATPDRQGKSAPKVHPSDRPYCYQVHPFSRFALIYMVAEASHPKTEPDLERKAPFLTPGFQLCGTPFITTYYDRL